MKRIVVVLFLVVLVASLAGCGAPAASSVSSEAEEISTTAENTVIDIDYVELLLSGDTHNEKMVRVAGKIEDFSITDDNEIMFYERIELNNEHLGFPIKIIDDGDTAKEKYDVGQYIVATGIWKSGRFAALNEAKIEAIGENAKTIADKYKSEWETEYKEKTKDIPLIDYTDLTENIEKYTGKYVRTVGKIKSVGKNNVTGHKYFSFWSRGKDDGLSIVLKGVPTEVQDKCNEDEYVIVCGKFSSSSFSSGQLNDCYIEAFGDDAKLHDEEFEATWEVRQLERRTEFINSCTTYTYEEVSRYPEKYKNQPVEFSGLVIQCKEGFPNDIILISTSMDGNNIIYVNYAGKQNGDARILENDIVTFYGELDGIESYTTVLGNYNSVPLFNAKYLK